VIYQGSGLPQRLQFALQAFVLYPLVLPVVELGFKGAEGDHEECRAAAHEARQTVSEIQHRLAEKLSHPLSECCAMPPADIATLFSTDQGRRRLETCVETGQACTLPPPPPPPPALPPPRSGWSGPGEESGEMWRRHKDDVSFIDTCKRVIRKLGSRGHAGEASVETSVRLLSSLDDIVRKAWEPRVRAVLTSPCAMAGTAGMWWAMLGHELAALCNFSASLPHAIKTMSSDASHSPSNEMQGLQAPFLHDAYTDA
jgi:hypothetical protein